MNLTTLEDVLNWAAQSFEEAGLYFGHGTNNAWDEAVALALFVLKLPVDTDNSVLEMILDQTSKEELIKLVNKRIDERIPVPYLTHEAWFAGLPFYVDTRVIIPRSPLGELIEKGFQPWIGQKPVRRILDLCTGSACIAIACAQLFPEATVDAVDISPEALAVAEENLRRYPCDGRVQLLQSDLFQACEGKQYDIIISNPPYVDMEEMKSLPGEFHWEPRLALEAGTDGLEIVNRILKDAPHYLSEDGLLIVEVGNAEKSLQHQHPNTPFTWLTFERGGEGVFLLKAEDKACWSIF